MSEQDIIEIYKKRWVIKSLFKQIKQNFPLRYFMGKALIPLNLDYQFITYDYQS